MQGLRPVLAAMAILSTMTSVAAATSARPEFLEQCVLALQKDGRPTEAADAACTCIARRTVDRPELRDEFLIQISAPRQAQTRSSPALRQVRAACVPMPIWAQGEES